MHWVRNVASYFVPCLTMFNTIDRLNNIDPDNNIHIDVHACKYFTVGEFNSNFGDDTAQYFLVNQNIQSFNAKHAIFEAFLNSLSHMPHSIVLTETWNDSNNLSLCKLDSFDAVHTHRERPVTQNRGTIGGGVSIFVNSTMYGIEKINNLSLCNANIETCVAKIYKLGNRGNDHYIVGIYRPRHDNDDTFISSLLEILSSELLVNKTVILAGDINNDILKQNDGYVNEYLYMLQSLNFIQVINKATRFPAGSNSTYNPSCLDHIFINKFTQFSGPIFFADISDHCGSALYFKLDNDPVTVDTKHKITFRLQNDQNISKFENKLAQTDWDFISAISDVNEQFSTFFNYVNNIYIECFPIKIKYVSEKRKNNPWITESTMAKIRMKSAYYKQFRNGLISREINNRIKNKLNKEIKQDKKNYYHNVFSVSDNNLKKAWNSLHHLLGTKNKKKSVDKIFAGATSNSDRSQIVNNFNNFFTNIGNTLASQMPNSSIPPVFPSDFNPHSFFLFPPTLEEIYNIILNLKNTWTPLDVLPVKLFKKFACILVVPITLIIENSIQNGIFPDDLKIARITPIHKEESYTEPSNFRPISSLLYLSKVFEKFFSSRLINFCNKYSIISPRQYGFQQGKSTVDALISLTEDIYSALDSKQHFLATLIDVKKAFDCVDHQILLTKLEVYGVRGIPLRWITSYLSNRKCYVELGSHRSELSTFNIGVPQGSILGPTLFLLYVNNLPKCSDALMTQLYADDTIISNTSSGLDTLIDTTNSELTKLQGWTQANKLTVHPGKTKLMVFSNRIVASHSPSISFMDRVITPVNNCKYLGIFLDNKLTFKNHIQFINSKISRYTGMLYKIRENLPIKTRLDFYYAYIYPYLSYCTIIWGGTYATHLQPLIIQQKRTIRTITGAGFRDHTDPLFKQLKLLKLVDIYHFQLGTYMYLARARGEFTAPSNYQTRESNRAYGPYHRLTTTQHAPSYAGPIFWRSLPPHLRSIGSYKRFKKSLKNHLLDNY